MLKTGRKRKITVIVIITMFTYITSDSPKAVLFSVGYCYIFPASRIREVLLAGCYTLPTNEDLTVKDLTVFKKKMQPVNETNVLKNDKNIEKNVILSKIH